MSDLFKETVVATAFYAVGSRTDGMKSRRYSLEMVGNRFVEEKVVATALYAVGNP